MPTTTHKQARPRRSAPHRATRTGDRGWSIRRAAGTEILVADALAALPWLVHGFSTRIGGASKLTASPTLRNPSLNLGFTEWDRREIVLRNRAQFLRALGAGKMPLATMRQIHSDLALLFTAAAPPAEPLQGDAAITQRAGLLVSVQVADCVPILLVDSAKRAVAAVHAGWRGTLARIVQKTIGRMRQEFGTRPQDILAALGPAIGRCSYEVGPEVAQAFAGQFPEARQWFDGPFDRLAFGEPPVLLPWLTMMPPGHEPPPERVQLDLRAANHWQLTDAGVLPGKIAVSSLCTACRTDLFFSYRREGGPDGKPTGRMMATIGIRAEAARRAARKTAKAKAAKAKAAKKAPPKRAAAKRRRHSR